MSLNMSKELELLQEAYGEKFKELELVKANPLDMTSMTRALENSTYVIHATSPYKG